MYFCLQFHDVRLEIEDGLAIGRGNALSQLLELGLEDIEVLCLLEPFGAQLTSFGRGEVVEGIAGAGVVEDELEILVACGRGGGCELLDTSEGALKASYHIAVKKITEFFKSRD